MGEQCQQGVPTPLLLKAVFLLTHSLGWVKCFKRTRLQTHCESSFWREGGADKSQNFKEDSYYSKSVSSRFLEVIGSYLADKSCVIFKPGGPESPQIHPTQSWKLSYLKKFSKTLCWFTKSVGPTGRVRSSERIFIFFSSLRAQTCGFEPHVRVTTTTTDLAAITEMPRSWATPESSWRSGQVESLSTLSLVLSFTELYWQWLWVHNRH